MRPYRRFRHLYIAFFYLFLFSIPFQTRKLIPTEYSYSTGSFTEYGSVFIYLSDILFALSIISYLAFSDDIHSLFKGLSMSVRKVYILLSIFCLFAFFSTLVNHQFLSIEIFRSLKIIELSLICVFASRVLKDDSIMSKSLFVLIFSAFFQSIIAIYQFYFQSSLFSTPLLHKLTGESVLSPDLPGIAKIIVEGGQYVRAYGTFPHPNLLGGFLIFSLALTYYKYLCHVRASVSSPTIISRPKFPVLFWTSAFTIELIALALTFSRSAWLGLIICIMSGIILHNVSRETLSDRNSRSIVSRGTFNSLLTNTKKFKELSISLILLIVFIFINSNLYYERSIQDARSLAGAPEPSLALTNNTYLDRLFYINVSRETFSSGPLIGHGPGSFIFQIPTYLKKNHIYALDSWGFQPVHNIYLLTLTELGLIGLFLLLSVILCIFMTNIHQIVSRETIHEHKLFKLTLLSVFISFLVIGLFDHYFLTFQQGALMFWLLLAMLLL